MQFIQQKIKTTQKGNEFHLNDLVYVGIIMVVSP